VSGSGISWTICKSAPRSRQITTPASHHRLFTGWMPFVPPNQQCHSTEGIVKKYTGHAAIDQKLPVAGSTATAPQQHLCCCGPMLGKTDGHRAVT